MATAARGRRTRHAAARPSDARPRPRPERLAALTGVITLLLGLAGWIVLEGPADRPEANVDPAAFLTYFGERDVVILGSFLVMLSVVSFPWFLGALRAVLEHAEGLSALVAVPLWIAATGLMLMRVERGRSPRRPTRS